MQRPSTAERGQREVARVVAALHRHQPQRAVHVLVDDVEDALRGLIHVQAEFPADAFDRLGRGVGIQPHLPAQQIRRQVAEHDVGVRDRRFASPPTVTGRPGLGPGALRPDAQRTRDFRDVRDRPAARAHAAHVHRRHLDGEIAQRGLARDGLAAVPTQGHVGRSAAHVQGQHVGEPGLLGDIERAGHTARGTRHHGVHRPLLRQRERHQPRVRAQDVHVRAQAVGRQLVREVTHVAGDLGPHVGVHHRGQGALVLAEFGQHFGRGRDRHRGQHFAGDLFGALLVMLVGVRIDERNRQRLDAAGAQVLQIAAQRILVQRNDDLAARVDALDRLAGIFDGGRRIGLLHNHPAGQRSRRPRPRQVQDLFEALRGNQSDCGALALQHRVGRDGRAVHDAVDVARRDLGQAADLVDAGQHADRRVRGGGRRLDPHLPARPLVEQQQVGKRSAHVDAEFERHGKPAFPLYLGSTCNASPESMPSERGSGPTRSNVRRESASAGSGTARKTTRRPERLARYLPAYSFLPGTRASRPHPKRARRPRSQVMPIGTVAAHYEETARTAASYDSAVSPFSMPSNSWCTTRNTRSM